MHLLKLLFKSARNLNYTFISVVFLYFFLHCEILIVLCLCCLVSK